MTRTLKALALALIAIFVISAVAASAAPAQGTFTSDSPATLIGTNTGAESANALEEFGFTIACPETLYTGHELGSITKGVPNGATSFTVTPHYGLCATGPGAFRTTVSMNGCDYVLDLEGTIEEKEDEYALKTTVVCPEEKHITITMFTNAADHAAGKAFCDMTITESSEGYTGLRAKDTTNNSIDIAGTIEGIKAHKKVGADGGILCPTATKENGVLHVDVSVEDKGEAAIGISSELAG